MLVFRQMEEVVVPKKFPLESPFMFLVDQPLPIPQVLRGHWPSCHN